MQHRLNLISLFKLQLYKE